jgi:hypothetical protein
MQERRKPALAIGNCHFRVCSVIGIASSIARSFACALESEMHLVCCSDFLADEVPTKSLPNLGGLLRLMHRRFGSRRPSRITAGNSWVRYIRKRARSLSLKVSTIRSTGFRVCTCVRSQQPCLAGGRTFSQR